MSITPYKNVKDFRLNEDLPKTDAISSIIDLTIAAEYILSSNVYVLSKNLEPVRIAEGSNLLANEIPESLLENDLVLLNKESQLNGLNNPVIHCSNPKDGFDIATKLYVRNSLMYSNFSANVAAFLMEDVVGNLYSVSVKNSKLVLRHIANKIRIFQKLTPNDFILQCLEIARVLDYTIHTNNILLVEDIASTFDDIVAAYPPVDLVLEPPENMYDLSNNMNLYIENKNNELFGRRI